MANEINFQLRYRQIKDLTYKGPDLYTYTRTTGTTIYISKPDGKYESEGIPYINYYKNLESKDPTYVYSIRSIKINSEGRKLYKLVVDDLENGKVKPIWYYTSRSEGGFLRLCAQRSDGKYDKGFDYVSTTFVNIYLQESIFEIEKYYEMIEEDFLPSICYNYNYYKLPTGRFTSQPTYNDDLFIFLSEYFPHAGNMFLSKEDYDMKIKQIRTISRSSSRYNTIANKLLEYITRRGAEKIPDSTVSGKTKTYENLYDSILELFNDRFDFYMDSDNCTLFNKEIEIIDESPPRIVNANVCSLKIRSKETKHKLEIIYLRFKFSETEPSIKQILNIRHVGSYLLSSGIDEHYISSGILVNKVFDYIKQIIHISRVKGAASPPVSVSYVRIADIFNISPFLRYLDGERIETPKPSDKGRAMLVKEREERERRERERKRIVTPKAEKRVVVPDLVPGMHPGHIGFPMPPGYGGPPVVPVPGMYPGYNLGYIKKNK